MSSEQFDYVVVGAGSAVALLPIGSPRAAAMAHWAAGSAALQLHFAPVLYADHGRDLKTAMSGYGYAVMIYGLRISFNPDWTGGPRSSSPNGDSW